MKNKGLSYLACACLIIAAFLSGLYLGRSIGDAPVYTIQVPAGTTQSTSVSQGQSTLPSTTATTADTVAASTSPTATTDANATAPSQMTQAQPATTDVTASGGSININTADLEALQTLPKIGPKLAQAIIDYRNENGPFQSIGQITEVPGIGTGIFKLIKDHITVGG